MIHDELIDLYDGFVRDIDSAWTLSFDDLNDEVYNIDSDNHIITLHNYGLKQDSLMMSPYFKPQIMLAWVEALRMARHIESMAHRLKHYDPKTIMLIGRICSADTQAQKILTAWRAKSNDIHTLWKHILCGETSDMAVTFVYAFEKFLTSGLNENIAMNKATAVAFNKWFSCHERLRNCDYETLGIIDDMIDDEIKFKQKPLGQNILKMLTTLVGEKNSYIDKDLQKDILRNPYYAMISDDITQIHLDQIFKDLNTTKIGDVVFQDNVLAYRFAHCD